MAEHPPAPTRPASPSLWGHLHNQWDVLRVHRPVGGYLPVGQVDGDCAKCHTPWPCATAAAALGVGPSVTVSDEDREALLDDLAAIHDTVLMDEDPERALDGLPRIEAFVKAALASRPQAAVSVSRKQVERAANRTLVGTPEHPSRNPWSDRFRRQLYAFLGEFGIEVRDE